MTKENFFFRSSSKSEISKKIYETPLQIRNISQEYSTFSLFNSLHFCCCSVLVYNKIWINSIQWTQLSPKREKKNTFDTETYKYKNWSIQCWIFTESNASSDERIPIEWNKNLFFEQFPIKVFYEYYTQTKLGVTISLSYPSNRVFFFGVRGKWKTMKILIFFYSWFIFFYYYYSYSYGVEWFVKDFTCRGKKLMLVQKWITQMNRNWIIYSRCGKMDIDRKNIEEKNGCQWYRLLFLRCFLFVATQRTSSRDSTLIIPIHCALRTR